MRSWTRILLLGLAGCRAFDASLLNGDAGMRDAGELDANGTKDASTLDGHVDTHDDTDAGMAKLLDTCARPSGAPEIRPPSAQLVVTTAGLQNDFDRTTGLTCTGRGAPGNDGFVRIQVVGGEKWHFHVTARDVGSDPALYVLDSSCRAAQCDERNGEDLCGARSEKDGVIQRVGEEHFTFEAPATGTYYLGIDDAVQSAAGFTYDLFAIRPSCGNGGKTGGPEHGEACDPVKGPGTDPTCDDTLCRKILDPARSGGVLKESALHDDWAVADQLVVGSSGSLEVIGSIGQTCGYDMFAVNVEAGFALGAQLTGASGQPCPAGLPVTCAPEQEPGPCETPLEVKLALIASDGVTVLGEGTAPTTGSSCPSIAKTDPFAMSLPKGVYYVRLWAPETAPRFDYRLRVEVSAP